MAFQLEKPCGCQAVGMTAADRHLNPSRVEEEQKSSQHLVVTVAVNRNAEIPRGAFGVKPLPFLPSLPSATFTSHFHVPVVKERTFFFPGRAEVGSSLSHIPPTALCPGLKIFAPIRSLYRSFLDPTILMTSSKVFPLLLHPSDAKTETTSSNSIREEITGLHSGIIMFYFVGFY